MRREKAKNHAPSSRASEAQVEPKESDKDTLIQHSGVDSLSPPKEQKHQVTSAEGQGIRIKVGGILRQGEVAWKVGTKFHFNDFICKIDETKLFVQIAERKERLIESGRGFMQDCSQQFPSLAPKWERYFASIDQGSRMPNFPLIDEEFEADLIDAHQILMLHDQIIELEKQIENYYILAPYDGKIVSIRKKIGANVRKGEVVLVIKKGW